MPITQRETKPSVGVELQIIFTLSLVLPSFIHTMT